MQTWTNLHGTDIQLLFTSTRRQIELNDQRNLDQMIRRWYANFDELSGGNLYLFIANFFQLARTLAKKDIVSKAEILIDGRQV